MEPLERAKQEFIKSYDEHADALFRHCFFKVSDKEKAEDLVQETFVRTWKYISSGKEVRNIKTFLYRVASNLIIDYYRQGKNVSLDQLSEKGFDFSEARNGILENAEFSRVKDLIDELSEKDKEIIIWRFLDGLSPSEIADVLNIKENAASVRLNRAMKKLKEKMDTLE